MTRSITFLLSALTLLACGCVPSLHALYTEKEIVFDKTLLGTWKQDNGNSTWTFSKAKEKSNQYEVIVELKERDEQGKLKMKQSRLVGTLVKLEGKLYLDLYPGKLKSGQFDETGSLYAYHLIPAHTFAKISFDKTDLTIQMMKPDWIEKHLKANPDSIRHTTLSIPHRRVVLTAPTKDLQAFVRKHRNTQDAFGVTFHCKKQ